MAQGHNINQLESNGSKMADKPTRPWSSISKLNDTHWGAMIVPRHCQKTKEWAVTQFLEISNPSSKSPTLHQNGWNKPNLPLISIWNSIQSLSHVQLFVTPWIAAHQASLSITNFQSCSNWSPPSRWCDPTISSSVALFSSCLQCFPASGSFLISWLFASGGQSIRASASASDLPTNIQD